MHCVIYARAFSNAEQFIQRLELSITASPILCRCQVRFQGADMQVVEPNGNPWPAGHQTVMSECVIDGVRTFIMATSPSLITRIEEECKLRHYSPRTAAAYSHWTRQYYRFHGRRPPRELGAEHIQSFLTDLAVRKFSASSQNRLFRDLRGILH